MAKDHYNFVLDCSITMAWCFEDERSDYADNILDSLTNSIAIVPSLWPLEVANVLTIAKRNKRLTEIQATNFIEALSRLAINVDPSTSSRAMHSIYVLADQSNLTIYDASYLELAIREKIPLLTLDKSLINAAKKLHIPLKHLS
jgi:predicted nucleic acid-binding protein